LAEQPGLLAEQQVAPDQPLGERLDLGPEAAGG
jgi:hypothetical protein